MAAAKVMPESRRASCIQLLTTRIVQVYMPKETRKVDVQDLAVVARRVLHEIAKCPLLTVPSVVELSHV
jgi:hypothetical protein